MTPMAQAAALTTIAFGTGAAALSVMNNDIADLEVPQGPWEPGEALDGRVFYTSDIVIETGEVLEDILYFDDGRFQSAMCQIYCDFGWSEYQTWIEGDVIRFTTTTVCPEAPHTVVWYGTVTGDDIAFEGTWTTRRWYWTRQLSVSGAGAVELSEDQSASG